MGSYTPIDPKPGYYTSREYEDASTSSEAETQDNSGALEAGPGNSKRKAEDEPEKKRRSTKLRGSRG